MITIAAHSVTQQLLNFPRITCTCTCDLHTYLICQWDLEYHNRISVQPKVICYLQFNTCNGTGDRNVLYRAGKSDVIGTGVGNQSITSKINSRKNTVCNRCIRKIKSTMSYMIQNSFEKRRLLDEEVQLQDVSMLS